MPINPQPGRLGRYICKSVAGESYQAYIPPPLPPIPAIQLENMQDLMEKANQALGRLDGLASMLGNTTLFLYFYVRKEALLSSQIEGTQSSLSDLLLYESEEEPGVPLNDVQEVSSYVSAIYYGLKRLEEGFPLSLRLLREIHEILLSNSRGSEKSPGEFRRSQNWIGGTRPGNAMFVPPPPEQLMDCLDNFEKFMHDEYGRYPTLIKAALLHVQFETIHPFLDGNGRLGRLLITLLLCSEGTLSAPLLYLSLYLKMHRDVYYQLLQQVRENGDWESWLKFFFEGVLETSSQAVTSAKQILALFESDRELLQPSPGMNIYGKTQALSLLSVFDALKNNPILSIKQTAEKAGLAFPTAKRALEKLEKAGIVREMTGKRRGKIFIYDKYLQILQQGTEPLPR